MDKHLPPFIKLSWVLIIMLVLGFAVFQSMPEMAENSDSEDPIGLLMVKIQGEYLLGVTSILGANSEVASQAIMLDTGTVSQRQRYMAFMIALGEPKLAKQSALKMRVELVEHNIELTEQQTRVQEELDLLAEGVVAKANNHSIEESLGWFGKLLTANEEEIKVMESKARTKVLTVGAVVLCVMIAAIAGFIGLVILFVRAFGGYLKSGLDAAEKQHGVYSEVFVVWLILFTLMVSIAGIVGHQISGDNTFISMLLSLIAFFGSLSALFWARLRGIGWAQIRRDIGWVKGSGVVKETAWGRG